MIGTSRETVRRNSSRENKRKEGRKEKRGGGWEGRWWKRSTNGWLYDNNKQVDPSHLHSISLQVLFRTRPDPPVKDTAPDRRVCRLERVQQRLAQSSATQPRHGHQHTLT